jgi:N-acyl-D-amino-acid deacylase
MLDLALEDGLRTEFSVAFLNTNDQAVGRLMQNPQTLIGLSDGGAHVGVLCDAGYCTYVLRKWVRELNVLTLERAVQRMTSEPAQYMGIADRGFLRAGLAADITIFDETTVGSAERGEKAYDLPGNAKRVIMPSSGIDFTIVNGEVLYEQNAVTGAMSGRVLRS